MELEEGEVEVFDGNLERQEAGLGVDNLLQSFLDRLYAYFDLEHFRPQDVLCDRGTRYYEPTIEVPDFGESVSVSQVEDKVFWSYEVPLALKDSVSLKSSERVTKSRVKYKIRHEFVAEALTEEGTDRRLDEVFGPLGDEDDRITPDISVRDILGITHVVEIGTTRSPNEHGLTRMLNGKMYKYEMPLLNRKTKGPITYTVIVVGSGGVVSNNPLPISLVNELVVRMRIALAIENRAKAMGISLSSEEAESQKTQAARDILDRVSMMEPPKAKTGTCISIDSQYISSVLEEPSEELAAERFLTCVTKTIEKVKSAPPQMDVLKDSLKKLEDAENTRCDLKPICVMPLILTGQNSAGISVEFIGILPGGENQSLATLWSSAFSTACSSPTFRPEVESLLLTEAYSTNESVVEKAEEKRKAGRRTWHRVNLKTALTPPVMSYLRKDGVFGKSAKKDIMQQARKKEQKKPFHFNTPLEDIDKFMTDTTLMDDSPHQSSKSVGEVVELIKIAESLSHSEGVASGFIEPWLRSRLFQAVDLASDIAVELAASIKQNTSSTEFILKKVRNRDVFLLIKPTNSRSHLYYSIFIPDRAKAQELHGGCFRPFKKIHNGMATDFCSVNASKLENLANASSHLLSMAAFWAEFYKMEEASPRNFGVNEEALKMLLASLCVMMEDKATTEEVITLTRYMYMEMFKGPVNIRPPQPFKILGKFPSVIRSRLALWFYRRVIMAFTRMVNRPPTRIETPKKVEPDEQEDAPPDDGWEGLVNFISGGELHSASEAINIMYVGYFKNKNEEAQGNTEWKMVKKILEEEFSLDVDDKDGSWGDIRPGELPKGKQFGKNEVMFGCKIMEQRLQRMYGPEWKDLVTQEVSEALARHLTHEIATLKASSICDHSKTGERAKVGSYDKVWRVKVIEALATKLGLAGLNPMCNIDKIIKFVEQSSCGVIADLFRKNQHGGLREIYVLTIESRLVQLFVETVARQLCSYFEEETLTHPASKTRILDDHKTRAAREARARDSIFADLCSSRDKTRWNQNFVMPAMVIPLLRLTDKKMHNALARAMNLWANKLILIPPQVLKLLIEKTPLSSETYKEALEKFWGQCEGSNNERGFKNNWSRYLNLTTGMMQGILHYTSSLLHVSCLNASKHLTLIWLKKQYPSSRFSMSQVCSSDDSASILTVMCESNTSGLKKEDVMSFYSADLAMESLSLFCTFFCMRESVKSTISLYEYVEFNSEFILKNTMGIPMIKFVASCLSLTESSSFVQRFHTMYNLISEVRSSGLSATATFRCQVAQLWQHYKTMGSNSSILFGEFVKLSRQLPSPIHGFFLLDNHLLCGVMGYSFCRWMLVTNCKEAANKMHCLKATELEVLPDGGVVESLKITHGDNRRWTTMLDRIEEQVLHPKNPTHQKDALTGNVRVNKENNERRELLMNADPELLFRHPETEAELKTKLLIKASLPGVADSLGKGNPYIQALGMSIYSLFAHAFRQTVVRPVNKPGTTTLMKEKKTTRHSILSSLSSLIADEPEEPTSEESKAIMISCFPLLDKYQSAYEVILSYDESVLLKVSRMRVRHNLISIQPRTTVLPLSLLQMTSKLWFQHSVRCSERVFQRCLEETRLSLPWLSDTFDETLKQSPFTQPIELFNFLATRGEKSRRVKLYGPAIRSNRFTGQLNQLIRRTFIPSKVLCKIGTSLTGGERVDQISTELTLSLLIPLYRERLGRVERSLKHVVRGITGPEDLSSLSRRDAKIGAIALFKEGKIAPELVPQILRSINQGILVSFTKSQRPKIEGSKVKWVGNGEAVVLADGIQMRLSLQDDYVTRITVKSARLLLKQPSTLRQVFDQLNSVCLPLDRYAAHCVARFDGKNFSSPKGRGCPIIVDSDETDVYFDPPKMVFAVKGNACGIYSEAGNRSFPVLEVRASIRDVSLPVEFGESENLWAAWTSTMRLGRNRALELMLGLPKLRPGIDASEDSVRSLKEWVKETLKARLKFRNIGYSDYTYAGSLRDGPSSEGEVSDSDLEAFLSQMTSGDTLKEVDSLFNSMTQRLVATTETLIMDRMQGLPAEQEMLDNLNAGTILEYENEFSPFRTILCNLIAEEPYASRTVMSRGQMNYLYLHPFWDSFINALEEDEAGFFRKTLQGVVSTRNEQVAKVIMSIFSIEKRERELSITERFLREQQKQSGKALGWFQDEETEDKD